MADLYAALYTTGLPGTQGVRADSSSALYSTPVGEGHEAPSKDAAQPPGLSKKPGRNVLIVAISLIAALTVGLAVWLLLRDSSPTDEDLLSSDEGNQQEQNYEQDEATPPAPSPTPVPSPVSPSPAVSSPSPTPETPELNELTIAIYKQYYDILSNAVGQYGVGGDYTDFSGMFIPPGMYFAGLIDLDNDGIPELLFTSFVEDEAVIKLHIYGYTDETGSVEKLFTGESALFSTGPNMFFIVNSDDGRKFLFEAHRYGKDYYSLENGYFAVVLDLAIGGDHHSPEYYTLNGEIVSKAVFDSAPQTILGITDPPEQHDMRDNGDYDLYDNIETIQATLAIIEALIN